jgi:hypothetical protein
MAWMWTKTVNPLFPRKLKGKFGLKFIDALCALAEFIEDAAFSAWSVNKPLNAPPDALEPIGEQWQVLRGLGEPELDYRARLARRWEWAVQLGTVPGIKAALAAIGCGNVQIYDDLTRLSDRRQYVIVIRSPSPFDAVSLVQWDDPNHKWDDAQHLWDGGGVDPKYIQVALRIIYECRSAGSIPAELVIPITGDVDSTAIPTGQAIVVNLLGGLTR